MKTITTIILTAILTASIITARLYQGGGSVGIAWSWGGVEIIGEPGLFICPGNTEPWTLEYTPNPIAPLFPDLLTDC
jgi:hypothetical protein